MKKRSIVIFIVSILIFSAVFFLGQTALTFFNFKPDTSISGEDLGAGNVIEQKKPDELVFLLTGVDKNLDQKGAAQDQEVRTDTMMLCKVNFSSGNIDIISIPRDTKVTINGKTHKINAAHTYGGMALTMKTVRKTFNIDVDYYMEVNYKAVVKIVDALGGVEVNSPQAIKYDAINVNIPKGKSVLDGNNALYFARARELLKNGSDTNRINNQHQFMVDLVKTALSPRNIPRLPKVINIFAKEVRTNIPIKSLMGEVLNFANFSSDKIHAITLPGRYNDWQSLPKSEQIAYYLMDKPKVRSLMKDKFRDYLFKSSESYE